MKYTVTIPNWTPPSVNRLLNVHWATGSRIKAGASQMIAAYCTYAKVPLADGKRRVSMHITKSGRGRLPDSDNLAKITFDALKTTGYIVDDSQKWLEYEPPVIVRGDKTQTVITLEDMA